jgi:hypothetical protein
LAAAIEAPRGELVVALEKGKDAEVRFALGPVELEFQVEVSREMGADAGIKFWVVALGGEGSRSSATTQSVQVWRSSGRRGSMSRAGRRFRRGGLISEV